MPKMTIMPPLPNTIAIAHIVVVVVVVIAAVVSLLLHVYPVFLSLLLLVMVVLVGTRCIPSQQFRTQRNLSAADT